MLPLLGEVMAEAGWAWVDLGLVAVTAGPGTFTGLRGVSRPGLALECPVLGVGTLEIVAAAAMASRPEIARPWIVAIDARRDEVYTQRFAAIRPLWGHPPWLRCTNCRSTGLQFGRRRLGLGAARRRSDARGR